MKVPTKPGLLVATVAVVVSCIPEVPAEAAEGSERLRGCHGVLFAMQTGRPGREGLWELQTGRRRPRLLMRFGPDAEVVAAEVAPQATVAVELSARARPAPAGMYVFSGTWTPNSAQRILVVAFRGRRPRILVRFPGSSPAWSRDGTRLAFERGDEIVVVSRPTWTHPDVVVWGEDPTWSPKGNALAFVRGTRRSTSVHVLTPRGGSRATYDSRIDTAPLWSPEGRRILFSRRKRPLGWGDLWVVDPRADREQRLTHFNHYNGAVSPAWSPDGRRVAFTMANSEGSGFWMAHVPTGRITVPDHPVDLGLLGPHTRAGEWSSRHTLVYEAGVDRRSLWEYSLRTGAARRLLARRPGLRVLDRALCARGTTPQTRSFAIVARVSTPGGRRGFRT